MRKKIVKVLKYFLITIGCILLLLIGIILSLRLPAVQNFVKNKAIDFVEGKIKTKISLGRIYVGFPNTIEVENLYLQGQDVDTLLYVHQLGIGLNLPKLLQNTAQFTSIDLDGLRSSIIKRADSTYNFDYIINAFASEDNETSDSKPFVINLNKIKLKNIQVSYEDQLSKNKLAAQITDLKVGVDEFDLNQNNYFIDAIEAEGFQLTYSQDLLQEVQKTVEVVIDESTDESPLQFGINKLKLKDFNVVYKDDNSKTYAKIIFDNFNLNSNKIDLPNSDFEIEDVLLENAFLELQLPAETSTEVEVVNEEVETAGFPIKLLLDEAVLKNVNVIYNNSSPKVLVEGFDVNNINIIGLSGRLEAFSMSDDAILGAVNKLSFEEKSGFVLNELTADFKHTSTETVVEKLLLKTPYTELQRSLILTYNSLDDFSNQLGTVGINAQIPHSKIGFKDVLWLSPELKNVAPFDKYPYAVLNLDADIRGTVNDLLLQEFKLSGLDNLNIDAFGTVKNAMDINNLMVNLKIVDLTAGKKIISNLVPTNTLPESIELPEHLSAKGRIFYGLSALTADLNILSTFGNASLNARLDQKTKNAETYELQADLFSFNLGKLLKQEDLGVVTANVKANGLGFDFNNNEGELDLLISEAIYNNYTYNNLSLNAEIVKGNFEVLLKSDDENIDLNILALGVYDEEEPSVKISGDLNKIDFKELQFSENPMVIGGKINADFSSIHPDALNGDLSLTNFAIANGQEVFPIANLTLNSLSNDTNSIELKSQLLDASLNGKFKLTQIDSSLMNTLNQYYQLSENSNDSVIDSNQYFNLSVRLKDDDLIRKFVPELTSFSTIVLDANYDSSTEKIDLEGVIPQLHYGNYQLNQVGFFVKNDEEKLNYELSLNKLESEQFQLDDIVLNGFVANDSIDYNLMVEGENGSPQYKIAGIVATIDGLISTSLKTNGLRLNYEDWNVADNNLLTLSDNGILAQNLLLSNQQRLIEVQSQGETPESPIKITFENFEIASLTEIIRKDSLLAEGAINGEVTLIDPMNDLHFASDINISDLKLFGNLIGNLEAKVDNETAGVFNANIQLSGFDNNLNLTGNYQTAESRFDAKLQINTLNLKSIEGLSFGQLHDSEGYISGELNISGTTESPSILGNLKFNQVGFGITSLNSSFKDINDNVAFTSKGIEFNNFKIEDTDDNSLTLNGAILTKAYQDFDFDLRLHTRNFKVVNSDKTTNQMMYGTMAVNANINIKGNLDLPKVDGQITVTDATEFTFVLPQSSPALQEREGIIEFVDQDQIILNQTLTEENNEVESIKGLDVNLNIEVDKDAVISIVIDKSNGDFVEIKGEAQLSAGIDPSGKTTLVGTYEVDQGAYEMKVSALRRRFEIQQGSSITWTGEPMEADVDIIAIYKTRAAPLDLIQQQLTESTENINYYKQRLPFNTFLKMSGELLEPKISFDIEIDGNNPGVPSEVISMTNSKLEQLRTEESELNKQVFSLLLLNRFIGENPFQSSTGLSAESMARQSVSKILSQQLNNIAENLIQGVEVGFDLDSEDDYSTGNKEIRTYLNVDISKRFFNDRLKLSVGSNFGLEGNERENEQMTNIAGNFEIEYLLSRDGRYLLRAYRKDEYQVALQGQIIETGVGFVITLDYNKFVEILNRRKSQREYRRTFRTNQNETNE